MTRAEYQRDYYAKNRARLAAYRAKWYADHADVISARGALKRPFTKKEKAAYDAAYRKANLKKRAEYEADYYRANWQRIRNRQVGYSARYRQANKAKCTAYVVQRMAATLKRTPVWVNRDVIAAVYETAGVLGLHVDHIIPLRGKLVSGLHVETNLQLLTPEENRRKGAKFDPWTFVP